MGFNLFCEPLKFQAFDSFHVLVSEKYLNLRIVENTKKHFLEGIILERRFRL